jgi:hypothetical protein
MSSFLELFAGRRAKKVVAAIWVLAIFGSFAANLPGKFTDAEENESATRSRRRRWRRRSASRTASSRRWSSSIAAKAA